MLRLERIVAAEVDIKSDGQLTHLAEDAFRSYHRALHEFLVRRLTRTQDASDAVQEVFLRLLRLERSELVRNPQAYLYGIASHVVREYRDRARRERVTYDSPAVEHRAEHPRLLSTDELAESLGVERQIEKALAQLSPMELRILLYDRRDGLTHEEIAKTMGLSVHTVKKYFFRALALVRTSLQQQESQG
jgi:RNA polymerase sigma factor (sigma-70 family)